MTEDRFRRVEVLTEISLELHRLAEDSQRRILERQILMEQQAEERHRQSEEYYRQMEEDHQQMRDLLSRMAQTVALMQADIVRLDETR